MRDAAYETAFALIDAELALGELFQDDEIDEDMERYLWGFTPE